MNDKPPFQLDVSVDEALRTVARSILAEARSAIQEAERPAAEAVHDFRRQMKRWRAFLRLLGPFLGADGKELRDHARDLARALGGARDAQSALDALADLDGLDLPKRSLATMRGRIDELRHAAETNTLTADMRLKVMRSLDQALGAVEHWPLHSLAFVDVARRLTRGYRAAQDALPEHWSAANGSELHELRKRIVTHRHQMEMVVPFWRRFGKMWIGEAQRLRDRLGKHQDLLLLMHMTEPGQPLAHWHKRLKPAIEQRAAEHVGGASRIAQRLFVDKPKAFQRRIEVMWEAATKPPG
jgi:CHAD domain-containing protein